MFKDNDVICFLGDSITASGLWEAEVYQFLRKKYKIKCYNCGVSGSSARKALGYMYEECLIYNPDYVVLMFGMNDFSRGLYSKEWAHLEDLEQQREKAIDTHKQSYESIIKACKNAGSEVIICLTTPHDEITVREAENIPYQHILDKGAKFHLDMAEKYNCKVVNFKDNMLPMLGKREIIRFDRVHPTSEGYHIMAQIFLKELGFIDECDFDTPFEFEDWNKARYDAEQKNHGLDYVELCQFYDEGYAQNKSVDEIKELAKEQLAGYEDKTTFVPKSLAEYIESGHLRFKNKGETVKLTK